MPAIAVAERVTSRGQAIRLEGGLFGPDFLELLKSGELPGQKAADFGVADRPLLEEIAAVYRDAKRYWEAFRSGLERLSPGDPGTSLTRERWMIPFLSLLGYEPRYNRRAYEVDGRTFAISHRAGKSEDAPPVHIVGVRRELGKRPPSGRPRLSPHALVQEYLNRTEHTWGLVTNGEILRLLRKTPMVRHQAYVEFDLVAIFEEERFRDFEVLYRLLHRTRLPRGLDDAHECWLERYYLEAIEQGTRARDRLRDSVVKAIKILANGFLRHPRNGELRRKAAGSRDSFAIEFYRALLRLVYRFLFLLVAEERGLLGGNDLYREHYSVSRLRRLADNRRAYTDHEDLWHSLRALWYLLRDTSTEVDGKPLASLLGLPVLDGELFAPLDDIEGLHLSNRDLLEAVWHLSYYRNEHGNPRRVNYAYLDVEELGSVYESLLELQPVIRGEWRTANGEWGVAGGVVEFDFVEGTERKSTGSYYTPHELVNELVKSALEPVLEERLAEAKRMANSEWRELPEPVRRRIANELISRLSRSRGVATGHENCEESLRTDPEVPSERAIRPDQSNPSSGGFDPGEHRRGLGSPLHSGIYPVSQTGQRQPDGTRNPFAPLRGDWSMSSGTDPADAGGTEDPRETAYQLGTQPITEDELSTIWANTPFAIRYSLLAESAILSLKVCDPATGSGHFLLAAARRLGKELARVRTGEEEPDPDVVREAIRDVITHCIYGVDVNPLAVELCKVALWIEGHTPGKPLTFLDHRIKCGNSLIGVFDLSVLEEGIPDDAYKPVTGDDKETAKALKKQNRNERKAWKAGQYHLFEEDLRELAGKFAALEELGDSTPEEIQHKEQLYRDLLGDPRFQRDRTACNLWTAAFFAELTPGNSGKVPTSEALRRYLAGEPIDPRIIAYAEALAERYKFFHWPLEFPEVFAANSEQRVASGDWRVANGESRVAKNHSPVPTRYSPGFDVVLGNPPFMGGLKISGELGAQFRKWLVSTFTPFKGTADLCAAFYRQAFFLLRAGGRMGMVATNTIGQGDTRESGLAVILKQGGVITFARRFIKWPGAANVEVNLVSIQKAKADVSPDTYQLSPILDGQPVAFISSRLDDEPEVEPRPLPQNKDKAFQGSIVLGMGFVLQPNEAQALLAKDPRNADCLFPYLNGEDLNSHPEQKPSRWVICFHDWNLERARQYPHLLRIVEEKVKPEREKLRDSIPIQAKRKTFWWQYGSPATHLYRAIASLQRVLVISRVSEHHAICYAPNGIIFADRLVVFAFDDAYHFALLQSSLHELWARRQGFTLESRYCYAPTDCFETFPFPLEEYEKIASGRWQLEDMPPAFQRAAQIGSKYYEHRRQIMLTRWIGLTKTYNLFHDPNCQDADIVRLRELHAAMDRAILSCYGWDDIDPNHDFYKNERGQTRFTVSLEARREILRRLLALNLELAE